MIRKMEVEKEIRLAEIKAQSAENFQATQSDSRAAEATSAQDNSLAGRTKRYGDTLRHVLPLMPTQNANLPQFFDTVEKLYDIYQVPADVQAKLLIPLMSNQAKSIGRMTSTDLAEYDKIKKFLLSEFRLTPKEYKSRFDNANKTSEKTFVRFTSRLHNLLTYYLRSRETLLLLMLYVS